MPTQPDGYPWPSDGALGPISGTSPFAAYVHIPFCTVRCGYCDFNTYTTGFGKGANLETYADSVLQEIVLSAKVLTKANPHLRPVESLFFGGGTPSLLRPRAIKQIIKSLEESFGIKDGAEVTLEANPENLDEQAAEAFVDAGVNRFSIGMQSAVAQVLKTLDRTHNPANVPRAVAAAKKAGAQVSVDLIYGAPGETLEQWQESIEAAIALAPDHISAYSLIIEEGTKMGQDLRRGLIAKPDADLEADKYVAACATLEKAGYHWYEISNFSTTPETRSTHNLAYWRDWDWWGYGPGAHSHVGEKRWWNVKHPRAYAGRLETGVSPGVAGETLTFEDTWLEKVMLGIRTSEGLDAADLANTQELANQGLLDALELGKGRAVLTLRGRLLADLVTRSLLGWD